jgi:hypothetical protein
MLVVVRSVYGYGCSLPTGYFISHQFTFGAPSIWRYAVLKRQYCRTGKLYYRPPGAYRARAIWDCGRTWLDMRLRPSVSWSHDVDGYGSQWPVWWICRLSAWVWMLNTRALRQPGVPTDFRWQVQPDRYFDFVASFGMNFLSGREIFLRDEYD